MGLLQFPCVIFDPLPLPANRFHCISPVLLRFGHYTAIVAQNERHDKANHVAYPGAAPLCTGYVDADADANELCTGTVQAS